MKIKWLGTENDGTRSIEIRSGEISYNSLLRIIRKIPNTTVIHPAKDDLYPYAVSIIKYEDLIFSIEIPFSDYIINCESNSDSFDKFVDTLTAYSVRWWEKFM